MYSIRGGCSSDSSSETDSTSSTEGTITQVTISGANSVQAGGTAELTANPVFSGTVDTSKVTYSWNITSGGSYASLSSSNKNTATLTANSVTQSQSVTVLVIVKYGNLEKTAQKTITVGAESSDSGTESGGSADSGSGSSSGSGSESGSSTDSGSSAVLSSVSVSVDSSSIDYNGKAALTATPSFSSGSSEDVTYEWEITYGDSYATLTSNGATATLQGKNSTSYSQYVSVKVTAKCNGYERSWSTGITVETKSSGISISADSSKIAYGESATLTAEATFYSGSSEDVTYEWKIIEGDSYATLTANGATATLYNKNSDSDAHSVRVQVTAKCGETEKSAYKYFYIQENKSIPNKIYKIEEKIVEINSDGTVTLTDSAGNTQNATADRKDETLTIYDLNGNVLYTVDTDSAGYGKIDTFKDGNSQSVEAELCYVVEHLQQNVEDDDYTFVEREILTGESGEQTAAVAKSYEGFYTPSFAQQTVSPYTTTTVEIKYRRKIIGLYFYITDSKFDNEIAGRYGAQVTPPENPTREGYTFDGWDSEIPETFPSEDKKITALWTANSLAITASTPEYSDDEDFLSVDASDSSKITFTASADSPCYWYVDGDLKSSSETTFTMKIEAYSAGYYTVMAISGKHSATVQVTVSK